MPERLIPVLDAVFMTFLSFFMLVNWFTLFTIVPALLSTFYWVKKIKHTQVNKHYNGSWVNWIKSFFNEK